jgi:hypothetical protein
MTLNVSPSAISLGGSTTGQSINLELTQSATATVSLNDTNVRTLAGVSSGAISMPTNFWGKSYVPPFQTTLTSIAYAIGSNANESILACDRSPANTTKPTTSSFFAISDGWASIYRSQNLGNTFSAVYTGGSYLSSIAAKAQSTSASTVCALGFGTYAGYVARSTNSGGSWSTVSFTDPTGNTQSSGGICANQYPGSTEWMMAITSVTNSTTYILRSTDSGASWSSVGSFSSNVVGLAVGESVFIACSNDAATASRWMVCVYTVGIFTSSNSGASWSSVLSTGGYGGSNPTFRSMSYGNGTWVTSVEPLSNDSARMGYYYSTNNGGSWTLVQYPNAQNYPPSGSNFTYGRGFSNFVEDKNSGVGNFVFSVSALGASTVTSKVFVSTDNGASITNTPTIGGAGAQSPSAAVSSYGPVIAPQATGGGTMYTIVPS